MTSRKEFLEGMSAVPNDQYSSIIGYLTWYSVGDDLYNREDLRKNMLQNEVEEHYLPNPIRSADAFRRATKAIETKRFREEETAEEYRNYIIRDVVSTRNKIQRNIVVETVNQKGERLDYDPEGAKLYFDKKSDMFTFDAINPMAEELAEEAQRYFKCFLTHHNGASVRACVVNYLNELSPTPVRPSGGVYFVPIQYAASLRNIVHFVMDLPRGESHMIPLVNDEDNRQMIKDKVKDNLQKVLEQCRAAIHDEGNKFQKGQVKGIVDDARRVVSQFKDYRELLKDTVSDLESSVELVRQSITLVMQKGDQ
ncbi:DUF6744 family protein [Bacillus sp. 1P06AnD]|uniref:DUF6744 family protein n=1 Tax=Bacillus sp. 1P06AnD TaxID=3132208 RepID=UPI0039A07AFE